MRLVQLFPTKVLGVVADHGEFPVERLKMDMPSSSSDPASSSSPSRWLGSVSHEDVLKMTDLGDALEESDAEDEGTAGDGRDVRMLGNDDDDDDDKDGESLEPSEALPPPPPRSLPLLSSGGGGESARTGKVRKATDEDVDEDEGRAGADSDTATAGATNNTTAPQQKNKKRKKNKKGGGDSGVDPSFFSGL